MNNDANKLLPTYRKLYPTPIEGRQTVISIALDQSKISSSSNVNYTFPKLLPGVCVNPDSSVHLSPGSSSFLPKYDINNNYSKLV